MTMNSSENLRPPLLFGKRLLLVEDNEAARRGLTKFLQAQGYEVSSYANGTDAIQSMRRESVPEIVLTDMQLPDVDGRDVAEFANQLDPRPQVGAITGWDLDSDGKAPLPAGIDWILLKPINVQELLLRLSPPRPAEAAPSVPSCCQELSQDDLERAGEVG